MKEFNNRTYCWVFLWRVCQHTVCLEFLTPRLHFCSYLTSLQTLLSNLAVERLTLSQSSVKHKTSSKDRPAQGPGSMMCHSLPHTEASALHLCWTPANKLNYSSHSYSGSLGLDVPVVLRSWLQWECFIFYHSRSKRGRMWSHRRRFNNFKVQLKCV